MQHILITGGTGTLGSLVVERLRNAGHTVRVLSRSSHEAREGIEFVTGDLATGEGVDTAVAGAGVIVHCAGSAKGDDEKAHNLIRAAAQAGARHLVYISVVGADRVPVAGGVDRAMFGYFASKLAAEHAVADSGLPWTTLRATQFHESMLAVVQQMTKLPVIPVPAGFRFQPIVSLWLPGRAARAHRAGANLAPERAVGRKTWEEFLAERVNLSGDNSLTPARRSTAPQNTPQTPPR